MVGNHVLVAFALVAFPGTSLAAQTPWIATEGVELREARIAESLTACFVEEAKLTAGDQTSVGDTLGSSVSLSNDTALVGAPNEGDDSGQLSGAAYVFVRNGAIWIEEAQLTASDSEAFRFFGVSVSLSGDTALMGAHGDGHEGFWTGSAYVFVRSGRSWTEEAKLTASDAADHDHFGWAVSTVRRHGARGRLRKRRQRIRFRLGLRVRAQRDELDRAGEAHGQRRRGRRPLRHLGLDLRRYGAGGRGRIRLCLRVRAQRDELDRGGEAHGQRRRARFGWSVSLAGDTALVGAPLDDDNGTDSGAAYVFVRNGAIWTEEAKLTASDGAADDQFGFSVSLAGDRALVGAHEDDEEGGSGPAQPTCSGAAA